MIALRDRPAVICPAIEVDGKLVPWSVPDICTGRTRAGKRYRYARTNPALKAFQAHVGIEAALAMEGKPHDGPVELVLWLWKKADGVKHRPGDWWTESPDLTNLQKAIEDALQGHVYLNDKQVVNTQVLKKYHIADGCRIVPLALPARRREESDGVHAEAADENPF